MRRLLLILLATVGALSLTGCNLFGRGQDDVATIDSETPQETVDPEEATTPGGDDLPGVPEAQEAVPGAVVTATPGAATVVAPDLIQSTNPSERAISVQRSRPDPFASLVPLEVPGVEANSQPGAGSPAAQGGGGNNAGGTATAAAPGAPGAQPGGVVGSPAVSGPAGQPTPVAAQPGAIPTPLSALPPVPQPTAAQAVRISGVVQIGGTPYAIVQVPNEVERYVRTGERVAGGRVLVKRIDTRAVEPRVILEQNGIEVESLVTGGTDVAAEPTELPPPEQAPQTQAALPSSELPALPAPGI
ncbi:MAG: hypothetical protein AAF152_05600 [Cyanobacteria bacterium P01_A01_bin.114]